MNEPTDVSGITSVFGASTLLAVSLLGGFGVGYIVLASANAPADSRLAAHIEALIVEDAAAFEDLRPLRTVDVGPGVRAITDIVYAGDGVVVLAETESGPRMVGIQADGTRSVELSELEIALDTSTAEEYSIRARAVESEVWVDSKANGQVTLFDVAQWRRGRRLSAPVGDLMESEDAWVWLTHGLALVQPLVTDGTASLWRWSAEEGEADSTTIAWPVESRRNAVKPQERMNPYPVVAEPRGGRFAIAFERRIQIYEASGALLTAISGPTVSHTGAGMDSLGGVSTYRDLTASRRWILALSLRGDENSDSAATVQAFTWDGVSLGSWSIKNAATQIAANASGTNLD